MISFHLAPVRKVECKTLARFAPLETNQNALSGMLFMYVFYDQLWYRRASNDDAPFGIGLGFVLATSTGQFSFALAGGQSENQNLSFSEVRAHFGFISRF